MTCHTCINDEGNVHAHINRAHMVHADSKGHSGLFVMFKNGTIISVSKKFGMITNSLTETELVSNRERFPKCT